MQSEEIFELTKNIKFCLRVLSWIKLSTEYLPEVQQEKAFEILCGVVNTKLLGMKNGDTKLLPGGWCSFEKTGHFMLYLIKRVDSNTYIKTRINSHFSSDSKSKTIKINHEQSLQTKDLHNFVQDLFSLQFPLLFQSLDIFSLEDHEKMDFCEKYDELEFSKSIFMEGQTHINNCAFMAFNALYIYMQSESPDTEFQIAFRKYLKCLIK